MESQRKTPTKIPPFFRLWLSQQHNKKKPDDAAAQGILKRRQHFVDSIKRQQ